MTSVALHAGDNRESLRRLIDSGVRVHSVVTDPPYGLTSIVNRFGKQGSAAAKVVGTDGSFGRLSGGFMGQAWDGTQIERDPEFWRLVHDILLPGGYCFAFSSSRTGHWQAVAMEHAGFIMHPMHGWVFGSGFPKAVAADKQIDKALGAEREVISERPAYGIGGNGCYGGHGEGATAKETRPATPEAAQWEGWAYGTQAQKPALEPIYLAQRPFSEKTGSANILKHGVGAVNVDGCRVPAEKTVGWGGARGGSDDPTQSQGRSYRLGEGEPRPTEGRHPANLILDGSPDVAAMFPNSAGSGPARKLKRNAKPNQEGWGMNTTGPDVADLRDSGSGSAARFFHQFAPDPDPLVYCPKANKVDRASHLYQEGEQPHPTVKPVALMRYLVRHITPPGGTVLDPFAGTGTTAEAARAEGFDCVLMEQHPPYIEFLRRRFPEVSDLPKDTYPNEGVFA